MYNKLLKGKKDLKIKVLLKFFKSLDCSSNKRVISSFPAIPQTLMIQLNYDFGTNTYIIPACYPTESTLYSVPR